MNEREEAYLDRGRRRLESGDLEGAIDDFSEATRQAPDDYNAWLARGSAFARKLDLEAAIADLRRAIELAPATWEARETVESSLQKLEIKSMTLPGTIREFAARKKYRTITPEVIASIPDEKLVQALVDYVVDYCIRGDVAKQVEVVGKLARGLAWIYAMWLADVEVSNGGFAQFFSLFRGFAADALEGYRRIGSPRAPLMKRAMAAKGDWGGMDGEFVGLPDDDARRVEFIRKNPALFS